MDLPNRLVASMSAERTASGGFAATASTAPSNESRTPNQGKNPLVVLRLGPTGSGKTALSLALGQRLSG